MAAGDATDGSEATTSILNPGRVRNAATAEAARAGVAGGAVGFSPSAGAEFVLVRTGESSDAAGFVVAGGVAELVVAKATA
jgi:hypothetical protein